MDRLFLLQKGYVDRKNVDGIIFQNIFQNYCLRYCDDMKIVSDDSFDKDLPYGKLNKLIPVGYLNFVQAGLDKIAGHHVEMTPIEIPLHLRKFAGRDYRILPGKEIPQQCKTSDWFIKDASCLKNWNNLLMDGDCSDYIKDDTMYVLSEKVEFVSEYRVFVHRGEVLAIQNYLGDPLIFPDSVRIKNMVSEYEENSHPKSYTLDVGVMRKKSGNLKTVLIEIHPFVSCGLYGFYDPAILAMLEDGINWYFANSKGEKNET